MSRFHSTSISDPRFERDHLRYVTVRSKNLAGRGDITIFVPPGEDLQDLPIVMMLHGVYGSAWCWPLRTGVHIQAKALMDAGAIRPMVLAFPSDGLWRDGSGYLPHKDGCNYEKWIVEDVPDAVRQEVPSTSLNSPLFITGLSMGGYGALRIGASYPHLFRAFSGLSSITEFRHLSNWYENADLSEIAASAVHQPSVLNTVLDNQHHLRPFIFDCGSSDILIDANRDLHKRLTEEKIPHTYNEYTGEHSWAYWEEHIREHLIFFDGVLK